MEYSYPNGTICVAQSLYRPKALGSSRGFTKDGGVNERCEREEEVEIVPHVKGEKQEGSI